MNDLIPKSITPLQLFSENGLDPILGKIRAEIEKFVPNIETDKGRKEIASFARKIASSKVFIENAGKELVSGIKKQAKLIDNERKRSRDTLDQWRDEVRKPLTDYEEAEKARIEAERQFEIYLLEWDEAISEDTIFNREREIERKEAEFAKIEADRLAKEEAERLEKERIANEARIKKEAEEKALQDAEEKIRLEREAKEKAEREIIEANERAIEAKAQAERDRIAAEAKAKANQEAAVKKAQEEAEAKILEEKRAEAARIASERAEAERKASNKRHQASINNKILTHFSMIGISEEDSKKIITEVALGRVPYLQINY